MNYIRFQADGQLVFTQSTSFLQIPSCLYGFTNVSTSSCTTKSGRNAFLFEGTLDVYEESMTCDNCGSRMHINHTSSFTFWQHSYKCTFSS